MSARKTIHVDRPDGDIPGLIEVNSYLAKNFGVTVAAVIDTDNPERFRWVGTQLRSATVLRDRIQPGDVLVGPKTEWDS